MLRSETETGTGMEVQEIKKNKERGNIVVEVNIELASSADEAKRKRRKRIKKIFEQIENKFGGDVFTVEDVEYSRRKKGLNAKYEINRKWG